MAVSASGNDSQGCELQQREDEHAPRRLALAANRSGDLQFKERPLLRSRAALCLQRHLRPQSALLNARAPQGCASGVVRLQPLAWAPPLLPRTLGAQL